MKEQMKEMKQTLRKYLVLLILVMAGVGNIRAITESDIIINIQPNNSAGTVSVTNISGMTVTISATPASGYSIDAAHIIAEKMVAPSVAAPRRAPGIASKLDITDNGSTDNGGKSFSFTIPDGYAGAYVTVTFFESITGFTSITSLSQITNPSGNYQITADIDASGFSGLEEFKGTLDGGLHKIYNLTKPLFSSTSGSAVIRNITFEAVSIDVNSGNAGAVTASAAGNTRIYNCGILPTSVERNNKGEITGFYGSSVKGTGDVGSIVGTLDGNARVINCYSYATVSGGTNVGGIVGNNTYASTASEIKTMVMNCMFYGDITGGTNVSPVYGGENIDNLQGGLSNFNYYAYTQLKTATITKYNCALSVEDKYLNRFEYYRLLLNSNKKLAAFYATGSHANANQMAKWVLETADRSINSREPYPYPILKKQGYYPSIINPDFENAPDSATVGRNHGGKLGKTLSVTISMPDEQTGGIGKPSGASLSKTSLPLQRTDKDFDRFNYNYDKVQLPYYNDVGTGNYTGNRVVTGWMITEITEVANDPYKAANYPTTGITDYPNHNYADRKSSNKDLYSVSKRVFSQGAYFDVPYGVSAITIEPYWGNAIYVADQYYDVVYKNDYTGKQGVSQTGTQVTTSGDQPTKFNDQIVKTSISDIGSGATVYDNAVVLVGNFHLNNVPSGGDTPFTMMSVDEDNDHEPDYSLIYHHKNRTAICPIRFDFLNIPGTAQAQKPNGASLICNFTIFKTKGWFEVTNTSSFYSSQLEYENQANMTKSDAPLILLGGVIDQFVSTQSSKVDGHTIYIHVGGNVWINEFGMGTHSDGSQSTPHVPVSVTGGEYPGFYLTGTYKADATVSSDNAECYISGGYFHEVAGASLEKINGDVRWQIYNADIDNFFGGGINDAKPITGNITTDIYNSYVKLFCGGPKFGNMQGGKKVTTNAEGCTFGKFFGAGYGGTSIAKKKYYDLDTYNWSTLQGYYTTDRGKYFNGTTTGASQTSGKDYGKKGPGVATDFGYEFFVWSTGTTGARFFVNFAAFSLAQCNDVSSTLKKCTVETNFYGGGNLGKVVGTATSKLEDCTVKGSVYGAGYSASLPTVEVRDAGFTKDPNYNSQSGMFEPGVFSGTTTFTWQNAAAAGKTLTNGQSGSDLSNHILYTNTVLTGLGEVAKAVLSIDGTTTVLESVYGGGEESGVGGDTEVKVTGGTIGTTGKGGAEYGNVYGGGKGSIRDVRHGLVKGNTKVKIENTGTGENMIVPFIRHNVYGGGAYGSVGTFTYASDAADAAITGYTSGGKAEVIITGGTFGTTGSSNGMIFGSSRGDVGAEGSIHDKLAWVYDTDVKIGTSGSGSVFSTPTIKGSVYGGGENGHVFRNADVYIYSGTVGIPTGQEIDNQSGASYPYRGNVYGAGCGTDKYYLNPTEVEDPTDGNGDEYNPLAGIVQGNTTVNISGGHVVRNVYGAGAMGSVGTASDATSGKTTITVTGGRIGYNGNSNNDGNIFGAARGDLAATGDLALVRETEVNISYTTTPDADNEDMDVQLIAGSVFGGGEAGKVKGSVAVNMTGGLILKDLYGGGALADTQTSNWDATANSGAGGWATGKTSVSSTTTVRLTGGTILGEAYGGALGQKTGVNGASSDIAAYVYGDVLLDLNGTTTSGETGAAIDNTAKGCAVGQIFGCNNINGSPKGDVMVHVYATQNKDKGTIAQKYVLDNESLDKLSNTETDDAYVTRLKRILSDRITIAEALSISDLDDYKALISNNDATAAALKTAITNVTSGIDTKNTEADKRIINSVRYDMEAVYGGGNMAAYIPASPYTTSNTSGAKTQVIIEGCEVTSIETVYGGGNAAAVPETNVTIKSAYEIGYLFGGGNGKDKILINNVLTDNPGADIGQYHNGTEMVTYGTGNANSLMEGGYIHEAYGGSNTKGVVKGSLNQTSNPEGSTCDLAVDKIVGAGKYADIDGDVNMTLSCQPSKKVELLFAGADEANVNGNITLNITNGHFGKVFGGNNLGGVIKGKIKVNVEETGCQPIKIDDLYLGGNEAAYSVFGYYESEDIHPVTGKNILKPRTSATDPNLPVKLDGTSYTSIDQFTNYAQPELNIISCTYIGNVFGGGFGEGAIMYANPTVNVNMVKGDFGDDEDKGVPKVMTELGLDVTKTAPNPDKLGIIRNVFGGGDAANIEGSTTVNIATETGKSAYIIGSVFGGGNAADVKGNTNVTMSGGYVFNGVFGGGYAGNVGTFTRRTDAQYTSVFGHTAHDGCIGKPISCATGTGKCTVVVNGGQIGPISVALATEGMNRPAAQGGPVPEGWVWGAGQGLVEDPATHPDTHFTSYVGSTDVTIGGTAFVLESIIGGGEFGRVLGDTKVTITGNCQIGVGAGKVDANNKPIRYNDDDFINPSTATPEQINAKAANMPECSHFPYGEDTNNDGIKDRFLPYDPYYDEFKETTYITDDHPDLSPASSASPTDGKTWIGCVFAGGSGYMPYKKDDESGYDWCSSAGLVEGNTNLTISGGHILTNVYGGNEVTNVKGTCKVTMTGGTIGVPRTVQQIIDHPLTCYLFGAGKGDPRPHFNTETNVKDVEIDISGGIIYGSVFGGGEDGHVQRNVTMTIGKDDHTGPIIGTWGTTYVDGNIFGGGRGFAGDAYTAGNVAGCVDLDIKGGNILGSIYGGGRLGSVGYGLYPSTEDDTKYGAMRPDNTGDDGSKATIPGFKRGYIDVEISGGTIGNTHEYIIPNAANTPTDLNIANIASWTDANWKTWKTYNNIPLTEFDKENYRLKHTKGGNVFAGGMGRLYQLDGITPISAVNWWKVGCVKQTKLTVKGGIIKSNVYGGGELGAVKPYVNGTVVQGGTTEVIVQNENNTQIGTEVKNGSDVTQYTFGSVYGGGYGSTIENLNGTDDTTTENDNPKFVAGLVYGDTKIDMQGGKVLASIYGGGEVASVNGSADVAVSGGEVGKAKVGDKQFGGPTMGNVYGGGSGNANIVRCGRILKNTKVTISGTDTKIYHNVYGSGAYGTVGEFTYTTGTDGKVNGVTGLKTAGTGKAEVIITGGTIGTDGHENGMVFGSSRGDINKTGERDDHTAWVYNAFVTIGTQGSETGPAIKGSIYGSGENGHTFNNTDVKIHSGTIGVTDDASYLYRGNVYGGGCGTDKYYSDTSLETHNGNGDTYNPLAGIVYGNTTVTIDGGTIVRNVYGAGAMGSVGKKDANGAIIGGGKTTINVSGGTIGVSGTVGDGNVYGAARGDLNDDTNGLAEVKNTEVNIKPHLTDPTKPGANVKGSVFGGGEAGIVKGAVAVSMTGGNVLHDVYGGGALANTNTDNWGTNSWAAGKSSANNITTVNLTGGTVTGNVYGGGLGRMAVGESGQTGYVPAIEAKVYGNTTVELNNGVDDNAKGCIVEGSIFGCNNMSGSPQGATTVHIYKTQRKGATRITNTTGVTNAKEKGTKTNGEYNPGSFDVKAVYGGGNMAAFEPVDLTTGTTNVIIDGCESTSICHVYGGGNAASTPATNVTINGTYEIGELFGGGNGKDDIVKNNVTLPNPGANVGYKDYSEYYSEDEGVTWKVKDAENATTKEDRLASSYVYGTGVATVNVFGGLVHRVFGGSNTKGNVRQTALTLLEENGGCEFCVDEAYGGGKSAPMDAEAKLLMACIPGLQAAYGGAEAAAIKGNVTLNITNGTFDRVFGGNNLSGTIDGSITVNIEEIGCRPIKIGELYGGGNQAAYSVYGYKNTGTEEVPVYEVRTSNTDGTAVSIPTAPYSDTQYYADPQVNVKSFTSIGKIFGGGYGERATLVGNPTVSVNEVYGRYYNQDVSVVGEDAKTREDGYSIPSHAKGKIGAISEVFGGGNAAKVIGNTTVNIGTLAKVSVRSFEEKSVTVGASVEGLYTRSGDGTEESPYTYTAATGTAVEGTKYYEEKDVERDVLGVDIRGNVYGGGNNAEVTGNTNVVIGK